MELGVRDARGYGTRVKEVVSKGIGILKSNQRNIDKTPYLNHIYIYMCVCVCVCVCVYIYIYIDTHTRTHGGARFIVSAEGLLWSLQRI